MRTLLRDIADICELRFPIEHKHNYGYCLQADQPVFFTNTEEMLLNFDLLNAINSESADNRYILAEHHRPVGSEQMPLLIDTIDATLRDIVTNGITHEELTNAKEQLKASVVLGIESMETRMSRNGKAELIFGRHKTIDEVIAGVDAISMEACDRLIQTIFTKERATAIIDGTEQDV